MKALSKETVESGGLDALGERVFTDTRVRKALAALATNSSASFLDLVSGELGQPSVPLEALQRSLERVLDVAVTKQEPLAPKPGGIKYEPVGPLTPAKGGQFDLNHHLGGKSTLIRELFEAVDSFAESLGGDVSRQVRKYYVGYFRGKKSFFTVQVQKSRLLLYLALEAATATPWDEDVMRDATKFGHYGMGNVEYSLVTPDQLLDARALIKAAYER